MLVYAFLLTANHFKVERSEMLDWNNVLIKNKSQIEFPFSASSGRSRGDHGAIPRGLGQWPLARGSFSSSGAVLARKGSILSPKWPFYASRSMQFCNFSRAPGFQIPESLASPPLTGTNSVSATIFSPLAGFSCCPLLTVKGSQCQGGCRVGQICLAITLRRTSRQHKFKYCCYGFFVSQRKFSPNVKPE